MAGKMEASLPEVDRKAGSPAALSIKESLLKANREIDASRSDDPFTEPGTVKVFVGEPSQGHVDVIAHDNRKDLFFELARLEDRTPFRFFSGTTGRMLVTFARDTIAAEALKYNADWVLFIDDDMILPRKMFTAMARHMDTADIIVPLCFQRVHPYKPVLYRVKSEVNKEGVTIIGPTDQILDYPIHQTFDVDAAGFGVALVRTEIFRKMPKPWFFSNTALGEDIYFCVRARQLGFKILADTRVKIGHLGIPPCITELDFIKANRETLAEIQKDKLALLGEDGTGVEVSHE